MKDSAQSSTRERGQVAENIAADFLTRNGYRIVERNFRCKLGEIDIIARHGDELVFVEVRSRNSSLSRDPIYSVNRGKQQKIIRAAQVYLSRCRSAQAARFDVVLVTVGSKPQVTLIPDAFQTEFWSNAPQ